jgi:hypothetical protein
MMIEDFVYEAQQSWLYICTVNTRTHTPRPLSRSVALSFVPGKDRAHLQVRVDERGQPGASGCDDRASWQNRFFGRFLDRLPSRNMWIEHDCKHFAP